MSRYPDETTRRFDQQFAETEGERNKRLAAARKARGLPDGLALMKLQCLYELSKRVVIIPSNWKTSLVYDALVQDGTAMRVESGNPTMRRYEITKDGREYYAANPNPPLFK